jgi:dipeptidyl aminopeptidase/acylaminoacyl peptidase
MLLNQVKAVAVLCVLLGAIVVCLAEAGGPSSARSPLSLDDEPLAGRPAVDRSFPLDLAFSRRRPFTAYEKAAVSPTGKYIAYGVITPAKRRDDVWTLPSGLPIAFIGARVHLAEVASDKSVPLGSEGTTSFAPAWSPDGTKLAYYSDEGGSLRAWVYDVALGKATVAADMRVKVHLYTTTVMPPTWSPDGRQLLVPGLPADEAHVDPRPPRGRPVTGKGHPRPGTGVLVFQSGAEPAAPAAVRTEVFDTYASQVDLTAIDIRDGRTRLLLPSKLPGRSGPAFARYSPSGRFLAYISRARPAPTPVADEVLDVGVVKVGETEPLFVEQVSHLYEGRESYSGDLLGRGGVILAWHPTSDVLLFLNDQRLRRVDCTGDSKPKVSAPALQEWGRLNGYYLAFAQRGNAVLIGLLPQDAPPDSPSIAALGLIPLDGSAPRKFTLAEGFSVGQVIRRDGVSLWEPVPDTATILSADAEGSHTLVRRLDLIGGGWSTLRNEPATVDYQGMPRDGSFLVGMVQSYAKSPGVYRLDADFSLRDRIGAVEPRLDGREFGPAETFQTMVPLHDGGLKRVRTAVLLPPGAKCGDRLPAVVSVYGGADLSREVRDYGGGLVCTIPAPVFTTRGFAVLKVAAPMGPDGRPGQPVEELRDVVLPQVYRAAELGYIDINRVAVAGQSYGGYCAAALVSSTNLFRAAIAVSGMYDLTNMYAVFRPGDDFGVWWSEKGQGRMGQPPWSDLRRYVDNSPFFRADRIRTPILLIHGRSDDACPVDGAEKMFSALKRLNRTAQLAVYDDQGHVVYEWAQKEAIDATERILDFLDRHLVKVADPSTAR